MLLVDYYDRASDPHGCGLFAVIHCFEERAGSRLYSICSIFSIVFYVSVLYVTFQYIVQYIILRFNIVFYVSV